MDSGGQYAVLGLATLMLTLSASNWDMIPTTQYSIHHRTLCSFDLFIFFCTCIDIPIPVSLYGVLICTVHQVIDVLVVGTVVHPVQLLAVLITMMSPLYAVSLYSHIFFSEIYTYIIIGEQYSSIRYTTSLSTCSGLC